MSLNQDIAREVEEYWDRAEARLESISATMRNTSQLLELASEGGLTQEQKEALTTASKNMIDAAIAGIEGNIIQYLGYIGEPIEARSPLPDERGV